MLPVATLLLLELYAAVLDRLCENIFVRTKLKLTSGQEIKRSAYRLVDEQN